MTTKEAADALGLQPSRVRQLLLSGELSGERHGRDWAIHRPALDAYQAKRPELNTEGKRGRKFKITLPAAPPAPEPEGENNP